MAAIYSRDEPSWLVAAVSESLNSSRLLLLLYSLPQAAPAGQHLPLHLPKSLTSCSFSCSQSLVLPRLMVSYSWWIQSLGMIFMAPISQKVSLILYLSLRPNGLLMIEQSLHSVLICDIHTARFSLDCSQAAVCPCTPFRVHCRPHSDGCDYADYAIAYIWTEGHATYKRGWFSEKTLSKAISMS